MQNFKFLRNKAIFERVFQKNRGFQKNCRSNAFFAIKGQQPENYFFILKKPFLIFLGGVFLDFPD